MTPLAPSRTVAAAFALLLALPGASAAPVAGDLLVRSLLFEQPAEQVGALVFLHADAVQAAAVRLAAAGEGIAGAQWDYQGHEATAGGMSVSTLRALGGADPAQGRPFAAADARVDLAGAPGAYALNLHVSRAVAFQAAFPSGTQAALQRPELTRSGIQEASGDPGGNPLPSVPGMQGDAAGGYWSTLDADAPHVLTEAAGAATLRLRGTFTLELVGLDLRLTGRGADQHLHSGTERAPLAPGAPGAVQEVRHSFLRLTVTNGTLDLALAGAQRLQWSGPMAETTATAVSLQGATGSLLLANGQQQRLAGASASVEGPHRLKANPTQEGLQVAVAPADGHGQPLAPAASTVRLQAPLAWGAAVSLAAVAALLALGLRRRAPSLADIETKLEGGRFRGAARDAGRLLRRRPDLEDAVLGRAIALAKMGRNRRVVREVQAHLAVREPTDGALHYVLGLALQGIGRMEEARAAWAEALRRTPDLRAQVLPLLSGQQGSSPSSAVGPAVDGTAYA
ncbi:MAG TPA: hypothetical protein VHI93_01225 [Candidatus Thermoplasmatota archaeon]|nr:hypothetical protein [Candidatus Thermoplasmatota archaeon]